MAGTQLTDQFLLLLQLCGSSGVWLAGDVPVPNGDCGDTCVPLLSKSSQQPGIIRPWERLSHSPLSRSYAFKICAPSDCSLSLSFFSGFTQLQKVASKKFTCLLCGCAL